MEKFHLKTLFSDEKFGEVSINEERFKKDLSESLILLNTKLSSLDSTDYSVRELSDIKSEFNDKLGLNFDLSKCSFKDLKKLIDVFSFSGKGLGDPYSCDDSKVEKIVNRIEVEESVSLTKRIWKNLITSSDTYSDYSRQLINQLCMNIFFKVKSEKNISKKYMTIHHEFKIFSDECYRTIALKLLDENDNEVFKRLHLSSFDLQTDFGVRVSVEICKELRIYLNNIDTNRVNHLLSLLTNEKGEYIVTKELYRFVESLLLAFEGRNTSEEIVDIVSSFINTNIGDPRIRSEWSNISERAKKVFLKWQVSASTELFFKVISDSLEGSGDTNVKRWKKRENFWRQYLEKDYIQSAWLVLCPRGERYYNKIKSKDNKIPFGRINQDNNMLIMYIDRLKIVEFAPTGQVSIWYENDPSSPSDYNSHYNVDNVRKTYGSPTRLLVLPHDSGGSWMREVEKVIYRVTGIKLGNR
ncbi:EH signature domain-containing protein [Halobacteriovorax sp.]|uniref:EH signature domain-containing protein n=1 Tax=Halobacteriovorax sp. TaxID=2020862 RepID=UPI003AF23B2C